MTDLLTMPTLGTTESGGDIKMRRVLNRKVEGLMDADIVLCHLPHNTITPFVTWQMNVKDGETYWGHYHYEGTDHDEIVADFFKRGR